MKKSKVYRKAVNQMRALGDVPWPARRFKYPPTFARLSTQHQLVLQERCTRPVGETKVRQGRLKRKRSVPVLCGGKQIVKLGNGKRRVYCESCRARKKQQRLERRIELQLSSRCGIEPRAAQRARSAARRARSPSSAGQVCAEMALQVGRPPEGARRLDAP
jgi:hypothetical protein